ncbi:MAG: class I SAM-dependent methyltransferase [Pseudomonadota bacterium]
MPHTNAPLIPVFARWFGSWQVRIERRALPTDALAAAYDQQAPRWTRLTERMGYGRAYERLFACFFQSGRIAPGARPLRVLDCGTGTGSFALAMVRAWRCPVDLHAVDISPGMVATAAARFRTAGIAARVLQASVTALPFADASFDMVIAAHVLEHLPEPVAALAEMRRVLKPGGWIITSMTRQSWLGTYIQAKWRTHVLTPTRAGQWLREAGFAVEPFEAPSRGLFQLSSLTTIGHTIDAGAAGEELHV